MSAVRCRRGALDTGRFDRECERSVSVVERTTMGPGNAGYSTRTAAHNAAPTAPHGRSHRAGGVRGSGTAWRPALADESRSVGTRPATDDFPVPRGEQAS